MEVTFWVVDSYSCWSSVDLEGRKWEIEDEIILIEILQSDLS